MYIPYIERFRNQVNQNAEILIKILLHDEIIPRLEN
jgi:hypothetical protein